MRTGMRVLNVDAVDCQNATRMELFQYIKSRAHGTIVFNLVFDPDGFSRYDGGRMQAQIRAQRMRRKELLGSGDSEEQVLSVSVTKIQAAFRGMKSRKLSKAYLEQVSSQTADDGDDGDESGLVRVKPESIDSEYVSPHPCH
jgi:hypothetical protein